MTVKEAPKISSCKPSDNWTCVSFQPDLAKFGMDVLEEDTIGLMRRRVYDLAGILGKGVKVKIAVDTTSELHDYSIRVNNHI
jgi:DNA topoisomerase-2